MLIFQFLGINGQELRHGLFLHQAAITPMLC